MRTYICESCGDPFHDLTAFALHNCATIRCDGDCGHDGYQGTPCEDCTSANPERVCWDCLSAWASFAEPTA